MSCYDLILDELERREVAFVNMFAPFFICSVGAHLFNLQNKTKHIKVAHARAPDMRLHLMFVTPPGFGRSFFMRQFVDDWGVLGDSIPVASVVFLMLEGGAPMIYESGFWGDERSEIPKTLERGAVYKFNAKKDGQKLSRIADLTKIEDDSIPTVFTLKDYGVTFAKLSRLTEYAGGSDLFWGYIGRMIRNKASGDVIGFEIGDIDAGPITVWGTGGKFEDPDPHEFDVLQGLDDGMEVVVYGYVSKKDIADNPRINARGVWVVT